MAGTLTIGGMTAGMATGEKILGPISMMGKLVIGTITDVELAAGDNIIAVPKESTAALIVFPLASTPPEVKIRTNKNAADTGLPVAAGGYAVFPIQSGVTSLIINGAVSGVTELSFI